LLGSFFVLVDYSVRYIPEVVNAPLIGPFFKGGICATAAWIVAFPLETAKSVIQADHTGQYKKVRHATWKAMRDIVAQKGVKGLYRGFGPGASRSFVANGTSMIVYSWFQDAFRKHEAGLDE
jgi:solute carrier family 25 carnitine/acylcarnitine transporter 20/29